MLRVLRGVAPSSRASPKLPFSTTAYATSIVSTPYVGSLPAGEPDEHRLEAYSSISAGLKVPTCGPTGMCATHLLAAGRRNVIGYIYAHKAEREKKLICMWSTKGTVFHVWFGCNLHERKMID
jgi:hypothetical protein